MTQSTTKKITSTIITSEEKQKKKLGFLSVMIIATATCIGAGIFFKNSEVLNNNEYNMGFSILSWIAAIVGVFAIIFTIDDITSGAKKFKALGFLGWVRQFNGEAIYRGCRNFFIYVYLPTNCFFMSFYAMMSIQDAIECLNPAASKINVWIIILLAAIIWIWFIITTALSPVYAAIQGWVSMAIKFIPIAFIAIGGYIIFGLKHGEQFGPEPTKGLENFAPFISLLPGLGVLASIPAIFFAFDGFYTVSGDFESMKNPKKGPLAMSMGIAVVAAIYVLISIALLVITNTGSIPAMINAYDGEVWKWTMFFLNCFIFFSVLGVLNGFSLYSAALFRHLIVAEELPLAKKLNARGVGKWTPIIYAFTFYSVVFILCVFVGFFYFNNYEQYGKYKDDGTIINDSIDRIYSLCDILANWTSLFAFLFVGMAITGCLINKYTKKIVVDQPTSNQLLFKIGAYVFIILISLSTLYCVVESIYDLIYFPIAKSAIVNANGADITTSSFDVYYIYPQIIKFTLLVILLGVVYCPWIYQKIKKYPSVIWGKFTTKKNNTKEFSESIKIEQKPANKTNS